MCAPVQHRQTRKQACNLSGQLNDDYLASATVTAAAAASQDNRKGHGTIRSVQTNATINPHASYIDLPLGVRLA